MKHIGQIAISFLLTAGIFCAVLYASCSKDACKGVTCINGGMCSSGACFCPKPGIGGNSCEIIYRNLYSYPYLGVVSATGNYDSLHTVTDSLCINQVLLFSAGNDTSNFENMTLQWKDSSGTLLLTMPITLSNNSTTGSDFTVPPVTSDTFTYSGKGNVSVVNASLNLVRSHPHGKSTITFLFNNFSRE